MVAIKSVPRPGGMSALTKFAEIDLDVKLLGYLGAGM
jgi:hypothetical protein